MLTSTLVFDILALRQWAKEAFDLIEQSKRSMSEDSPAINRVSRSISLLIAHILSLSVLTTDLDLVRLRFTKDWIDKTETYGSLSSYVFEALRWHKNTYSPLHQIVGHALDILGHENSPKPTNDWIGSSRRGQVVLSTLLLDMKLEKEPCYQLLSVPGVLALQDRPKGETIEAVTSASAVSTRQDIVPVPSALIKSLARFAPIEHEWLCRISPRSLQVNLCLKHDKQAYGRSDLRDVFNACGRLVFIPRCDHDKDHVESERIEDYIFIQPENYLNISFSGHEGKIRVYPVRGNDPIRLMIIGTLHRQMELIGFSRNACLQCSLQICRKEGANYLVC